MNKLTKLTDLLQVLQTPPDALRTTGTPLAAELPVDPQTAPYLVTTTRSLMWHPKDFNGKVRAAMRTESAEYLYGEIIKEICATSVEAGWGSVFKHTLEGLADALDYVRSYGITDIEILAHDNNLDSLLQGITKWDGVDIVRVSYLPFRTIVVVPKDRDYLGILMQPGSADRRLALIHNASRGMAVAGWNS